VKKLGYAILGLFVALLLVLLVAPSFIDWNSYSQRLSREFRAHTGHELEISGALSLSLLPAPSLVAREVTLHRPGPDGLEHLVSLGGLQARLAFWPLISGELHLISIRLSQAHIDILADEAGGTNWDDLFARLGLRDQAPGARGFGLVRLEDMRLEGAEITLARGAKRYRLSELDAQLSAQSLQGPLQMQGKVSFGDAAGQAGRKDFRLRLGRLSETGQMSLSLWLDFLPPDENAGAASGKDSGADAVPGRGSGEGAGFRRLVGSLELEGSLSPKSWRFTGKMRWQGKDFVQDVRRTAVFKLPGYLAGAYELSGPVALDPAGIASSSLNLKTAAADFSGRAELLFGAPARLVLELTSGQFDLDALLAAQQDAPKQGAPVPDQGVEFGPAQLAIVGQINLGTDVVIYRGRILRQLRLSAELLRDRVEVAQLYAMLPGNSTVEIGGTWRPGGGSFGGLNGRFDLRSGNFREFLNWLSLEPEGVPPNRLRRMAAQGRFTASSEKLQLTAVDLTLDQTKATAAASLNLGARFGFGLRLHLDRVDFDAYGLAAPPAGAGPAGGGWLDFLRQVLSADPALLQRADINLDLAADRMLRRGGSLGDLALRATLLAGKLEVTDLRVGKLPGGGSLSASGRLADSAPMTFEGEYSAYVSDPQGLALWQALNLLGQGYGPLELAGRFAASSDRIALENRATLAQGHLDLTGTIDLTDPQRPFAFDMAYAQERAAKLFAGLLGFPPGEADLGKVALVARVQGDAAGMELAGIEGNLGPLNLSGAISLARPEQKLILADGFLDLLFADDDAEKLIQVLLPDLTSQGRLLKEDFGAVTLRAAARLDAGQWHLRDLSGEIGDMPVKGEARLDLHRSRPMLSLDLAAGRFDWTAIRRPPLSAGAQAGDLAEDELSPARWSAFLQALRSIDGDFRIALEEWDLGGWSLDELLLDAQVFSGLMDLKKLEAALSGGAVALAGKLDLSERLDFDITATLEQVDPAPFLEEQDPAFGGRGRIDLAARLSGSGRSKQAFKRSLSGNVTLSGKLDLRQVEESEVARYLELRLHPWLAQQNGLSEKLGHAIALFAGRPGDLDGDLSVTDGTLALKSLGFASGDRRLSLSGEANLPARYMNLLMRLSGEEEASLRLRGTFDAPAMTARGF
jgi:hypothetical protein